MDWINYQLEEDADLKNHLPVPEEGDALFKAVHDGLILWYVQLHVHVYMYVSDYLAPISTERICGALVQFNADLSDC